MTCSYVRDKQRQHHVENYNIIGADSELEEVFPFPYKGEAVFKKPTYRWLPDEEGIYRKSSISPTIHKLPLRTDIKPNYLFL